MFNKAFKLSWMSFSFSSSKRTKWWSLNIHVQHVLQHLISIDRWVLDLHLIVRIDTKITISSLLVTIPFWSMRTNFKLLFSISLLESKLDEHLVSYAIFFPLISLLTSSCNRMSIKALDLWRKLKRIHENIC